MSKINLHPDGNKSQRGIVFLNENKSLLFGLSLFGVLFYLLTGTLFGHTLHQPYPYPYFASDQFGYVALAEVALEQGHYLYTPGYMNNGMAEKSLTHYGPGVIHLIAIVTKLLSVEAFNASPLIFGFMFLFLPFIFLEASNLRGEIKFISLAFLPLLLTFNFVIGYLWGQYNAITGTFFLFLFFFALNNEKFRKPAYIGAILSMLAISHFPELFFAGIYLVVFLIIDFLDNKTPLTSAGFTGFVKKNRYLINSFLVFLALSAFYLVLFYYGNMHTLGSSSSEYKFRSVPPSEFWGLRVVTFQSFSTLVQGFILVGAVILLFSTRGIDATSKLMLFAAVLFSNFNYIGLFPQAAYRAFQQRFFWPFTLAPFVALVIYLITSALSRRSALISHYKTPILALAFLLFFAANIGGYRQITGPGVIFKEQFDAFRFLEKNVSDGDILFLYGHGYDQSSILLKKMHYTIPQDTMIKKINSGLDRAPLDVFRPAFPINAAFNGSRIIFVDTYTPTKTICDFRYYVLDRYSPSNDQMIMFNQLFFDSINKSAFRVRYNNGLVTILENVGGRECLL